jgi:hypothetical protein
MLKKSVMLCITIVFLLGMLACSAHVHQVGTGPQTGQTIEARQWYVLWGLIPLNDVNTQQMAGGANNYEIATEQGVLDIIINIFTGYVSVYSRTVKVTK